MTVSRQTILLHVRRWVQSAEDDLRLAEQVFQMQPPRPYPLAAFHAQQCAEKYLKAFLVCREVDFPFTHNIAALLELCEPLVYWETDLSSAERLSSYAVTARYPGLEQEVPEGEADRALKISRNVRTEVRRILLEMNALNEN